MHRGRATGAHGKRRDGGIAAPSSQGIASSKRTGAVFRQCIDDAIPFWYESPPVRIVPLNAHHVSLRPRCSSSRICASALTLRNRRRTPCSLGTTCAAHGINRKPEACPSQRHSGRGGGGGELTIGAVGISHEEGRATPGSRAFSTQGDTPTQNSSTSGERTRISQRGAPVRAPLGSLSAHRPQAPEGFHKLPTLGTRRVE